MHAEPYHSRFRIRGPGEGVSFVIPTLFVIPMKAGIQTLENLKLSPHRVPTILSQQGFSEVQDCGVQCFLRRCTMDSRESGNDGEGCRNDGEGVGDDGLVLWSPYPKLGLTGLHLTLWQRLECPDGRPQQDSLHNLAPAPH